MIPNVILNNGHKMPIIGLGTWQSKPGEVTQAVKDAIDIGYRHIDCAPVYLNEQEVGEAINAKIAEGVVKREELFITSKLANTVHRKDLVEGAIKSTLSDLNLSYLDMYLIHSPMGLKEEAGFWPVDENGKCIHSEVDYVETWKEMEKLVDTGLTKSIGVSNFNEEQVDRVCAIAKIIPATNQVECHPFLNQNKLKAHCEAKGITITAYSPLGCPGSPYALSGTPILIEDLRITKMADKYGKSAAQLLIRYQIQKGIIVIPKSVTKSRIAANFDVFNMEISRADMEILDSFDCNIRYCKHSYGNDHKYFPF